MRRRAPQRSWTQLRGTRGLHTWTLQRTSWRRKNIEDLLALFKWSLSLVAVHSLGIDVDPEVAMGIASACRQWVAENDPEAVAAAQQVGRPASRAGSMDEAADVGGLWTFRTLQQRW